MKGFGKNKKSKKEPLDSEIIINTKQENNLNNLSKEQIINKANNLYIKGKLEESKKYYQYFLDLGFNDPGLINNYAILSKQLGQIDESIKLFRKCINTFPDFYSAYSNLGNLLGEIGSLKEAKVCLLQALELNPNFADANSNLGNILRGLGDLEQAEIYTRRAIEINPDSASAYCNLGVILKDKGNLNEAEAASRKSIELNPEFSLAFSNLGSILIDLGNIKEAELALNKAIKLNPSCLFANYNLGMTLIDLGKFKEAELCLVKSINLKSDFARAYFVLAELRTIDKNITLRNQLFSNEILENKNKEEKINFYFARSYILHREKRYLESSNFLIKANDIKLSIKPSMIESIINKSKTLSLESSYYKSIKKPKASQIDCVFIVGMPRSGSTLLESIISMNNEITDLGEINIFEESYLEWKRFITTNANQNLQEIYLNKIKYICKKKVFKTTNKWLSNYQYVGILTKLLPSAKIIHIYRNPLDNILSIYRAHFSKGYSYSSSLEDVAKVWMHHDQIMNEYKTLYRPYIYDLNYDNLVSDSSNEIKKLISWLGWDWEDFYLKPHTNNRSVSTASHVQVRSPITAKSVGSWKNYQQLLLPAISIISKNKKYKDLFLSKYIF
tara:strand:+ start:2928 stop:4778 length:1851 start_codon:yes stop_codon:yes gene_type:complete